MQLYADTTSLRARQILGDLGLVVWIAAWVWVGRFAHSLVDSLAGPAGGLRSTGTTLGDAMRRGASTLADLPLVGDRLVVPFQQGAGAGDSIVRTSDDLVARIHDVALWTGLLVALVPILLGAVWWLGKRVAFVRTAATTRRFLDADADLDLFALRAMASQPLDRLDAISHDPVGAWRARDTAVIRALASLELRDMGLQAPAAGSVSAHTYREELARGE